MWFNIFLGVSTLMTIGTIYYRQKIVSYCDKIYKFYDILKIVTDRHQNRKDEKLVFYSKYLLIKYTQRGKDHQLRIKFDRKKSFFLSNVRVFTFEKRDNLEENDEQTKDDQIKDYIKEEITQQTGLPYLFSPNDLDVEYILATHSSGKSFEYRGDEKLLFLEELKKIVDD